MKPAMPDRLFGPRSGLAQVQAESVSGGARLVGATAANQGVRFVAMVILARLLTPTDFGVFAVVMAFAGAAGLLWELGLATATVQRRVITPQQVSAMFWINVSCAACITLAGVMAAPWLGRVYDDARVAEMCQWIAFSPLLSALGMQHLALMQRALEFRRTAAIGLAATLAGSTVSVVLALLGASFLALAAGLLAANTITSILAWLTCPWRPGRLWIDAPTREMLAFGGQLVGFGLLGTIAGGLHSALLGLISGAESAGLYHRAYSLVQLLQGFALGAIGTVATAALSHLQDRPMELRDYYLRCTRLLCAVGAPVSAIGWLFSSEVLHVLYGGQWDASAPLFGVLVLGFVCYALAYSTGWLYIATGNAARMMRWGLIGWTMVIAGTLIGLPLGLRGLAIAQTVTIVIVFFPCMTMAFAGTLITWSSLASNAWRPVVAALAAALLLHVVMPILAHSPWVRLVTGGALYALVYLFLLSEPLGQRAEIVGFCRAVLGRTPRGVT